MARTVLGLCDRFRCTPETALGMDASVFRLLAIEQAGTPEPAEGPGEF